MLHLFNYIYFLQSTFLRNVAWTLSNLCRAKSPPPPQEATRMCLPALARLIKLNDMEVVGELIFDNKNPFIPVQLHSQVFFSVKVKKVNN